MAVMAKQTGAKLARLDVNATGEDARVAEQAAKISGQMAERRKADIFWTVDCFIAGVSVCNWCKPSNNLQAQYRGKAG
jgi:hypothetical protein